MRRSGNWYPPSRAPLRLSKAAVAKMRAKGGPSSSRARGKRARGGQVNVRRAFVPPEDWHEPRGDGGYRFVVQSPGPGYRHVLSTEEIAARLAELPERFLEPLEVVQLSRMTRKKQSFPCYGMQWGSSLYLYPIEESLVEYYHRPPRPAQLNEARMYGGQWIQESSNLWKLQWTERAIKDFYLNNILIHELGHLQDDRNTNATDRERYAEWFAIRWGYRAGSTHRSGGKRTTRRHHAR